MIKRRGSKPVRIGAVVVGGGAPVVVQSMTNTDTRDAPATVAQIKRLGEQGCEIVRVAVPDMEAAQAIPAIKKAINLPLVADIHFDYRLALAAIAGGVDALRLNPGNIQNHQQVKAVVSAAKEREIPIRIGVNAGSLPPNLDGQEPSGKPQGVSERMVQAALSHIRLLEDLDFDLIKVSLKAFDVPTTIAAYQRMAELVSYPFHLGITEAGTPRAGSIRSAVGIGTLLHMGLGDTIRVSLTGDPVEEVITAYEILKALNLREHGPVMISCPTCGRTEIDLVGLALAVEKRLEGIDKPIKVAVMGCVVNGPGEAREADVGIAGGRGRGVIFRKGEIVRTVPESELYPALLAEIDKLLAETS
ncbi:MAG: flavodoxin-dependent (E)-4-hydroxy-3-methylbut-2-enyl-diphosphate synthase [Chloroflexi bacterium]|nr:flavodoxin-dependent (E)-4-hydroxy-3-methylbut-2-enyl-diphosphate synthase [Chloroflexota bacterium]MBI5956038.1 flavodoxin-dependent (E)-4-hydroxy-3-methylbut-2-enyl-diphosphate synthase [Chloroflexota bacterium]